MNRLYLDIGNGWVELVSSGSDEVRFNYTFDNLENPTKYISENSFSMRLPRCAHNNAFFGNMQTADSMLLNVPGIATYTPAMSMRYMVTDSTGEIVSTGDAWISEINEREFILSLVGMQSRIFRRLLNSGWDKDRANEDTEYTLLTDWVTYKKNGAQLIPSQNKLTRNSVLASWRIDNPIWDWEQVKSIAYLNLYYNVTEVSNTDAFIASIIGFAPTAQGRYKDFENDHWLEVGSFKYSLINYRPTGGNNYMEATFLPLLCNTRNFKNEPSNQLVEVADGAVEVQMSEYRSYYQQPFIYVYRLWQLIREAFENISGGYTLNLDSRWFNNNNDELAGMVYMLPKIYNENDINTRDSIAVTGNVSLSTSSAGTDTSEPQQILVNTSTTNTLTTIPISVGERVAMQGTSTLLFSLSISASINRTMYFAPCNCIEMAIGFTGEDVYKKYLICPLPDDNSLTEDDYYNSTQLSFYNYVANGYEIIFPKYTPFVASQTSSTNPILLLQLEQYLGLAYKGASEQSTKQMYIEFGFVNTYNAFCYKVDNSWMYSNFPPFLRLKNDGSVSYFEQSRSFSRLSLERLFKGISPGEVLMQYSKAHHLLWNVDATEKTVTVIRASDYMADCIDEGALDITGEIDTNGIIIRPATWDTQNIVMNMGTIDCDYISGYEERHGLTYGSKLIRTQNNINKDTTELLGDSAGSTITTSAMLSESVVSRADLQQTRQNAVEVPPMPLNVSNGECANIYGNFYYRHSNAGWLNINRNDGGVPFVYITDDTDKEVLFDRYTWHGDDAYNSDYAGTVQAVKCFVRPVFNTVADSGLSLLFAPVREVYTSTPDEATEYLYTRAWEDYIHDVYNLQNKTVEAYVYLNRKNFEQVRRNPIVYADHMLYLLCDIKGWSESTQLCRCKMRQLTDINRAETYYLLTAGRKVVTMPSGHRLTWRNVI